MGHILLMWVGGFVGFRVCWSRAGVSLVGRFYLCSNRILFLYKYILFPVGHFVPVSKQNAEIPNSHLSSGRLTSDSTKLYHDVGGHQESQAGGD